MAESVFASASLTVEDATVIVRARGEFDIASADALANALAEAAHSGLPVVVDLTEVSFMDAACLGRIARARDQLTRAGVELRVIGAHGVVRRVFELTNLTPVLSDR